MRGKSRALDPREVHIEAPKVHHKSI
jgi:hypothetical protein